MEDHQVVDYWRERTKKHGAKAAGYLGPFNIVLQALKVSAFHSAYQVRPGIRIIDVGTGVGNWAFYLARQGAVVDGIDLSGEMIEIAEERRDKNYGGLPVQFHHCCIEELFLQKDYYDLALTSSVLQHITTNTRLEQAFKRIAVVLRPGGVLIIMEPVLKRGRLQSGLYKPGNDWLVRRNREEWISRAEEAKLLLNREVGVHFFAKRIFDSRFFSVVRANDNGLSRPIDREGQGTQRASELSATFSYFGLPQEFENVYHLTSTQRAGLWVLFRLDQLLMRLSAIPSVRELADLRLFLFRKG
jgi:2-polyprenyl-3-methyl-5-hydroxy-6-metoxy-1,4-benzoquinol methylase